MTLADARAIVPALVVAEADASAEADLLAAIADWCRRFTPLAALDQPDGVLLDISGASHLFGGERALRAEIVAALAAQGLAARAALAGNPALAWALARFADIELVPAGIPERDLYKLVADLPIAALRIGAETIAALAQAGLRRIGDLSCVRARRSPRVSAPAWWRGSMRSSGNVAIRYRRASKRRPISSSGALPKALRGARTSRQRYQGLHTNSVHCSSATTKARARSMSACFVSMAS